MPRVKQIEPIHYRQIRPEGRPADRYTAPTPSFGLFPLVGDVEETRRFERLSVREVCCEAGTFDTDWKDFCLYSFKDGFAYGIVSRSSCYITIGIFIEKCD